MGFKQTNNYGIGDNNFTAFQETLDTTRRGLVEMSLSNYDTDAAPVVKVGSWFENNGSMFEVVTGDETPTGYGGISNSVTFYLYYSVSGDEFIYDSTTPVWNDALQGYYNSNDRALFSMYKDSGGTLYQNKNLLVAQNNYKFSGSVTFKPTTLGTRTTFALTVTPALIPNGIYQVIHKTTAGAFSFIEQKNSGGTWSTISTGNPASGFFGTAGGLIFSDGVNVRVSVFSSTANLEWLKFS